MKQGKKPTRQQKQLLKKWGKNPDNWLVTKSLPGELHIMHRVTGSRKTIVERRESIDKVK